MPSVLLDTDVLIDHYRASRTLRARGHRLFYSVISRMELFAGGDEARLRRLLVAFKEISVDRPIAERAGRLRRQLDIDPPDALIAATALEHKLALFTRNVRDYEQVRGLRLRDSL